MYLSKLTNEEIKDLDFILGYYFLQTINEDFVFTKNLNNLNIPLEIITSDVSMLQVIRRKIENEKHELKVKGDQEYIDTLINDLPDNKEDKHFRDKLRVNCISDEFAKEYLKGKIKDEVIKKLFKITPEEQLTILVEKYLRIFEERQKENNSKRRAHLEYKQMVLLGSIHGFLMSGIELDERYKGVFEGNDSQTVFENLIK